MEVALDRVIDCPKCGLPLHFVEFEREVYSRLVKDVRRVVHSSPGCELNSFETAFDVDPDALGDQQEVRAAFVRLHLGWDQ